MIRQASGLGAGAPHKSMAPPRKSMAPPQLASASRKPMAPPHLASASSKSMAPPPPAAGSPKNKGSPTSAQPKSKSKSNNSGPKSVQMHENADHHFAWDSKSDRHQFSCHISRLLEEFAFIRDLDDACKDLIPDIVSHASFRQGQILFHQDDKPEDCYIILTGEVELWRRKDAHLQAPDVPTLKEGHSEVRRHAEVILSMVREAELCNTTLRRRKTVKPTSAAVGKFSSHKFQNAVSKHMCDGSMAVENKRKKMDTLESDFLHIASVGPGMLIGEVSLLEDQDRNATAKCKTDVEFLVISHEDFDRVLKTSMNRLRFQQLSAPMSQFLKEFEFYKFLADDAQQKVPGICHYVHYTQGSLVFYEGNMPQHVFIILNGEVKVWRSDASEGAFPTAPPPPSKLLKMKTAGLLSRLREKEEYSQHADWVESPPEGTLGACVACFGPGQIFGDLALLEDRPRNASITCETDCELLVIDRDDFGKLVDTSARDTKLYLALPGHIQPLLPKIDFFEALDRRVQENIAYNMRFASHPEGKVLYWEGDAPNYCYLLLSGKVASWSKTSDQFGSLMNERPGTAKACPIVIQSCQDLVKAINKICGPETKNIERLVGPDGSTCRPSSTSTVMEQRKSKSDDHRRKSDDHRETLKESIEASRSTQNFLSTSSDAAHEARMMDVLGINDGFLGPGSVFGEYAMVNDTIRPKTMVCIEPCNFLVLSRADFDRVLREEVSRAKVKQLSTHVRRLLQEFAFFKDLDPVVQENLANVVRFSTKDAGQVIFEQGDAASLCYVILKGEVTVWIQTKESKRDAYQGNHDSHGERPAASMVEGEASLHSATVEEIRPPLELAGVLARERCSALSSMLSAAMGEKERSEQQAQHKANVFEQVRRNSIARRCSSTEHMAAVADVLANNMDDSILASTHTAVAALGAGSVFGELALINEHPRNATVSCHTNCGFLVIEKVDFDAILKVEMKKTKDQKVAFLRDIVPGVRSMQIDAVERLLYYFGKELVPRNHFFLEQGETLDGSIYFIWKGSVESYLKDPSTGTLVRRGIMLSGSVFAAVPQGSPASFSIVSTSSPCEVLRIKPESRRHFPDCVLRSLREVLDRAILRRNHACAPLAPMGSVFQSPSPSNTRAGSANHQIPHQRSGKIPRPLSGKIPNLIQSRGRDSPKKDFGRAAKLGLLQCSLPTFKNVFQREVLEVDYEAFDLDPGETMAMNGIKPQRRVRKPVREVKESTSLPALGSASSGMMSRSTFNGGSSLRSM